jgi:hypothetical protein
MTDKGDMKADYKHNQHRLRRMGVYCIKNRVNGKVFLAGSTNLDGTIARDRTWLPMGGHQNKGLQADWKTFGAEAFAIEELEVLTPSDAPRDYAGEVALLLALYMEQLAPYGDRGYMPRPRGARQLEA